VFIQKERLLTLHMPAGPDDKHRPALDIWVVMCIHLACAQLCCYVLLRQPKQPATAAMHAGNRRRAHRLSSIQMPATTPWVARAASGIYAAAPCAPNMQETSQCTAAASRKPCECAPACLQRVSMLVVCLQQAHCPLDSPMQLPPCQHVIHLPLSCCYIEVAVVPSIAHHSMSQHSTAGSRIWSVRHSA
jgi:hypothetical protein